MFDFLRLIAAESVLFWNSCSRNQRISDSLSFLFCEFSNFMIFKITESANFQSFLFTESLIFWFWNSRNIWFSEIDINGIYEFLNFKCSEFRTLWVSDSRNPSFSDFKIVWNVCFRWPSSVGCHVQRVSDLVHFENLQYFCTLNVFTFWWIFDFSRKCLDFARKCLDFRRKCLDRGKTEYVVTKDVVTLSTQYRVCVVFLNIVNQHLTKL